MAGASRRKIEGDGHDIWVWDLVRKSLTRVTTDPGTDQSPVWMPDGGRLVFKTEAGGVLGALAMQAPMAAAPPNG